LRIDAALRHPEVAKFATVTPFIAIAAPPPVRVRAVSTKIRVSEAIIPLLKKRDIVMLKIAIAAAALLLPVVASAEEAPKQSFVYQGVTYTYTTEVQNGAKILKGSAYNGKVPFELKVTKAGVSGTFNRAPVSFDMHEVQHLDSKDVVAGQ
jgi:hypothetical protein